MVCQAVCRPILDSYGSCRSRALPVSWIYCHVPQKLQKFCKCKRFSGDRTPIKEFVKILITMFVIENLETLQEVEDSLALCEDLSKWFYPMLLKLDAILNMGLVEYFLRQLSKKIEDIRSKLSPIVPAEIDLHRPPIYSMHTASQKNYQNATAKEECLHWLQLVTLTQIILQTTSVINSIQPALRNVAMKIFRDLRGICFVRKLYLNIQHEFSLNNTHFVNLG